MFTFIDYSKKLPINFSELKELSHLPINTDKDYQGACELYDYLDTQIQEIENEAAAKTMALKSFQREISKSQELYLMKRQ